MRSQSIPSVGHAVSERAVRDAISRRRRSSVQAPKAAAQDTGARLLRRWSVAELIAAAAARPSATRMSH